MIKKSLICALRFTNFCRQSRQGNGMQSSLHRNSVVAHNLVPLKRQKKYHHVPVYSLLAGPQSPIMPLHAVAGNKADTVGLMCFWSFFFAIKYVHLPCACAHMYRRQTRWQIDLLKLCKSGKEIQEYLMLLHQFSVFTGNISLMRSQNSLAAVLIRYYSFSERVIKHCPKS